MSEIWPLEMFLQTVHCNHTVWQAAIYVLLSAKTQTMTVVQIVCSMSYLFIFLPYVLQQPFNEKISTVVIHMVLWYLKIQEINSWKTGYGWVIIAPFYWQSFHTDQHLMGFIINSDVSSPLCLALVGVKQNKRLTFLRLRSIDLVHPTVRKAN